MKRTNQSALGTRNPVFRRHPLATAISGLSSTRFRLGYAAGSMALFAGLAGLSAPGWAATCAPGATTACSASGGLGALNGSNGGAGNGDGGQTAFYVGNTAADVMGNGGSGAPGDFGIALGGSSMVYVDSSPAEFLGMFLGHNGAAGPAGVSLGSGGGGGGTGIFFTASSLTADTGVTVRGGNGGNGGNSIDGGVGGGGGGGGAGLITTAPGATIKNYGSLAGGNGGNGGNGGFSGGGGGGGDGLLVLGASTAITNTGSIAGGTGGNAGTGTMANGTDGNGGAGINLAGGGHNDITNVGTISGGNANIAAAGIGIITSGNDFITNGGMISGGWSAGSGRAAAIQFNGTNNRLNLMTGSNIVGGIQLASGSTATIAAQSAGLSLNNDISLGSASTLTFDTNMTSLTYSGALSGTGMLSMYGSNTLTLTGVNTYTGGTVIGSGTLEIAGNGTLGSGNVLNNGTLLFNPTGNLAAGNNITGSGTLVKNGAGTLILTGNNNYAGGTTISAGTLVLGGNGTLGSGQVTNSGSLVFNRSGDYTVLNTITGTGTITKAGTGTMTLTGANTYTGDTIVNAGTLNVDGTLAGTAVTVNSGGTLGGTGSIGSGGTVTIKSGGTIAANTPGDGLSITGNLTLENGSTYRVAATPSASGKLMVSGTATLDHSTVAIQAQAGAWAPSTTYTLLSAGTLNAYSPLVTSNFAYLTPTVTLTGTELKVRLDLQQQGLTLAGSNHNQSDVSGALNRILQSGGNTVTTALSSASTSEAPAVLSQLAGEPATVATSVSRTRSSQVTTQLIDRMAGLRLGGSFASGGLASDLDGVQVAQAGPTEFGLGIRDDAASEGLWTAADYSHRRDNANRSLGNHAASTDSEAITLGYDRMVTPSVRLGAALSADHNRSSLDGLDATVKSDGVMAMVYGSYRQPESPAYVSGMTGYGRWNNTSDRVVTLGSLTEAPHGKYDTSSAVAYVETGYNLGDDSARVWQPYAGMKVGRYRQDAYSESGSSNFGLTYGSSKDTVTSSVLGVRHLVSGKEAGGKKLDFLGDVQWQHNFGSTENRVNAAFVSSPEYGYQVYGAPSSKNSVRVAGSVRWQQQKNMYLFGQLNAQAESDAHSVGASFGAVWKF